MKNFFIILLVVLFCHLFGEEFLQKEVDSALSCIQHPHKEWIEQRFTRNGEPILDVAIIGGGQTGLTIAFSLKRHCIHNLRVFDKSSEDASGSWINMAEWKHLELQSQQPDLILTFLR